MTVSPKQKIDWRKLRDLSALLKKNDLNTVCVSARCPNKSECFGKKTATFLILGDTCTRHCRFCSVKKDGSLQPPDIEEAQRIAGFARSLDLDHIVVTSVTRDDLADGGAGHFARTIAAIKTDNASAIMEVLTPDFQGDMAALDMVMGSAPEIFNHNIETVPRLYAEIRPQAGYRRSLDVLAYVKAHYPAAVTKSGLMLGLGETRAEIVSVLRDLREAACDVIVLGQYFQPAKENVPVSRYLPEEEFSELVEIARGLGFLSVAAGPYMRSSYMARELYQKIKNQFRS